MQTSKLISTVSYNTPEFLCGKLNALVSSGVLEYAHWVVHSPEEDENKTHIHIVAKPNRRLDTSALRNEFTELVSGETLPRGVLPFRSTSRMSDWLLYSAHDVGYLLRKGETRIHTYELTQFESTCTELLQEDWRECHRAEDSKIPLLLEFAKRGKTWFDILQLGILPTNQLFQYKEIFFTFLQAHTERNGREGHEQYERTR